MEGRVQRSDVEIVGYEKIVCQKKKKRLGRDGSSSSVDTIDDRISQLPDHLLHHILSYLSTRDVFSISVLSKTWHRVWTSFPIWDFCESLLGLAVDNSGMEGSEIKDRREKFFQFVLNSVLRQCNYNGGIQKFRLSMTLDFDPQLASHIHRWITLAAQNGVTQLHLNFEVPILPSNYVYCLPQTIFSAEALKVFKLSGLRLKLLLNLDSSINWPSLQVLSLDKVYVDERVIQNLNRGCPLIEKLALLYCFNLRSIRLSGFEKLNKVKVVETNDYLKRIEIDVPSLRTFSYAGGFKDCPNIDVTACKNLEVLKLRSCTLTNQVCQDLISKFPSLKTLSCRCFMLSRIKIVSQRLEKLELSSLNQVEATIVTPRIQSFKYDAPYTPSVFSLFGSGLQKVYLKLFPKYLTAYRFLKMREYLGNFNQIKQLTLHIVLGSVTFEHERLKDTPLPALPVVEHLKLKITSSLSGAEAQARAREYYEALVDGLLWICHPESLFLVPGWGSNNEFMKVLCQKLMHRAERPDRCTDSPIRCWWHELKGMSIKQFERNEETMALTCDILLESLPTLAPQERIGFALNW